FSSRRRHTRSKRDWSSDVCSSDLVFDFYLNGGQGPIEPPTRGFSVQAGSIGQRRADAIKSCARCSARATTVRCALRISSPPSMRSEERRVGKQISSRLYAT